MHSKQALMAVFAEVFQAVALIMGGKVYVELLFKNSTWNVAPSSSCCWPCAAHLHLAVPLYPTLQGQAPGTFQVASLLAAEIGAVTVTRCICNLLLVVYGCPEVCM